MPDGTANQAIVTVDPLELLPSILADFVRDAVYRMQSPVDAAIVAGLCSAATMLGKDIRIQVKRNDPSWKERAALWSVIVGDPSTIKLHQLTSYYVAFKISRLPRLKSAT